MGDNKKFDIKFPWGKVPQFMKKDSWKGSGTSSSGPMEKLKEDFTIGNKVIIFLFIFK